MPRACSGLPFSAGTSSRTTIGTASSTPLESGESACSWRRTMFRPTGRMGSFPNKCISTCTWTIREPRMKRQSPSVPDCSKQLLILMLPKATRYICRPGRASVLHRLGAPVSGGARGVRCRPPWGREIQEKARRPNLTEWLRPRPDRWGGALPAERGLTQVRLTATVTATRQTIGRQRDPHCPSDWASADPRERPARTL
jgi:hypothetical protein